MSDVRLIELDARDWRDWDDVMSALLGALGAPPWHGRNLDALYDSLSGGMNEVEPPFALIIEGASEITPVVAGFLGEIEEVFDAARHNFGQDVRLYRQ